MTLTISGGQWQGRRLPEIKGVSAQALRAQSLRPTTGRVREAIFQSKWLRPHLEGCRFLDLFAGSGVMGLEALSYGAALVVAVEQDRRTVQHLQQLPTLFDIPPAQYTVLQRDALKLPQNTAAGFDIIYADPPYGYDHWDALITHLVSKGYVHADTLFVAEQRKHDPPIESPHLHVLDTRTYGDSCVTFYGATL